MEKPDILVFMSDQHTPLFSGFGGGIAETPFMDEMCRTGTSFTETYSACPLCVPARASMLTALRPSKTGIFTLSDAIPDTTPTFLHNLVEAGYETVLIGRMHFVGQDQRHGFTKRLASDMTPLGWTRPVKALAEERGVFSRTFGAKFSTEVIGGGESPVQHYDDHVVEEALKYLSEKHEKPQFICVSIYAPHFPYVAPEALFSKYINRVTLPESFHDEVTHPLLRHYVNKGADESTALWAQAAYCGMVERTDQLLEKVAGAFDRHCERNDRKKVICYISDHGDQCGDRRIFGKETLFERSVRIPLIFSGDGIDPGVTINEPASIMDLGPTLLEMVGAEAMDDDVDGISLAHVLHGEEPTRRHVYSEFLERTDRGEKYGPRTGAQYSYGLMVREGPYKLITYSGYEMYDMLFDTANDPDERCNLMSSRSDVYARLRKIADRISMQGQAVRLQKKHDRAALLFARYEEAAGIADGIERWKDNPSTAKVNPAICLNGSSNK